MKEKTTWGGKRPNSGRKPGKRMKEVCITLPPCLFSIIEDKRKTMSRSKFIAQNLQHLKE